MSNTTIVPYLFFSGRCGEAIDFYTKNLDAELTMQLLFSESPDPVPEGILPTGFEHKIMHASLKVAGAELMLSDGCEVTPNFGGFKLALSVHDESTAHRYFNALATGGEITMALTKTFWSPCYGMVTDQFGVEWMVMVPGAMPA